MALRRRTWKREVSGAELLGAWAAAVGGPPPGMSARLRDASEDLAFAAVGRSVDVNGAMSRFGWQAGHDGWPLTEVRRWVEVLASIGPIGTSGLLTFELGLSLSVGWADGFLHGAHQDDCVEPTTGLAQLGVLQLRLQQVYEQCRALGVDPDLAYAVVVVDAALGDHPVFERSAARVALATETKGLFNTGETVAIHGERVLILASRTAELDDRVVLLAAAVHTHPLLRHDHIEIWVEHLPSRPELLSPFLVDVTS